MRDIPEAKRFILAAEKLRQCYNDLLFPKRFGASRVTAGAYPSVLASFLPRVFAELPELSPLKKGGLKGFVEQFPNVSVHLTSGEGMQLLQQVHDETLDCAIVDEGLTDFYAQSLTYERLFSSKPIGFLYRADNREMVQHASRPAEFSFNCMATQTVFLIDEDHPLYRAWKGLLVAPRPGVGTWVYLRTFSQVRAAIAAVKNGVGLGIPLDSDEQEGIKHFDFSGLVGNDDRIRTLRQYRINHFALYLRCNWKESPANGGLSLPAKGLVACMRAAVTDADGVRYTHPYLA